MKKRIWVAVAAITLLLGLSAAFAACNVSSAAKADYSVTVLSPAETPLSGVTVNWNSSSKKEGSATTDAEGRATASLPLGSYTVSLENFGEGYTYTSASVSSNMRNVMLTLSVEKVTYTVTVTDKAGAPAKGVTATWANGSAIAGTATTNENGVASREFDYGNYSVTISNLPDGNVYTDGARSVTGKSPAAVFALRDGVSVRYTVTVRSEGGLLFKQHPVTVRDANRLDVASGVTDDNGVFSFSAVAGGYTAITGDLPRGYAQRPASFTAEKREADLILASEILPVSDSANASYVIGDIFHDYTFTTPYTVNGKPWQSSVSEILKTKQALIINNWGTNCSWCVREMPAMQSAYEKYGDSVEIVAVSNYPSPPDSDSVVSNFHANNPYTFPMMRDTNGFASKFGISGWPTTVVIDRYGAIARIESGAVTSDEAWDRLILKYIGDDYVQTFVPGDKVSDSITEEIARPDVTVPADHYEKLSAAFNDTNLFPPNTSVVWRGETEYEMAWPFLYGTVEGVSDKDAVIYASNSGRANSIAILYATVNVAAGKVFTFEYYADTEENCDLLLLLWDGKIVKTISGKTDGWVTCYLYADLTDGEHSLSIAYRKDSSANVGKDNVYLRRVGFANIEDIQGSADMLRAAAYGTPTENASTFPYYAETAIGSDGYYHVNTSKLQNATLAGNDSSPLLLANLMNATNWSSYSISQWAIATDQATGEYLIDCTMTVDGKPYNYRADLLKYLRAATSSDVDGCIPVNQKLHDILVDFLKKASGNNSHANEWLEICYFYSHYGEGDPVGNPIIGLMEETAIPVKEGTNTADLTRNTYPFPTTIYTFTPQTSAVYKFASLIPEELSASKAAQIWLYDDETSADNPLAYCGDAHVTRDGKNEHNFELYRYMTAGHKYYLSLAYQMAESGTYDFTITNVGQSATAMIPCSGDTYDMVIDGNGNFNGEIVLSNPIEYEKDKDGYYRAINPDKTMGDYIYLDLKYACTTALGTIPIERLVDKFVSDPVDHSDLSYKFFDFRYRITYFTKGNVTDYAPVTDYTSLGEKYKDYTDVVKRWIASAPTEGEHAGMIKVDQEVVDVLMLYIEMRVNMVLNGATDSLLENEWLRFCWYTRIYDANNV